MIGTTCIEKDVLERSGFGETSPEDYVSRGIVLRDGRDAVVWIHKKTGHGILDVQFWERQGYYSENYRQEFGAKIEQRVDPAEHLAIYRDLNERQFQTFSKYLEPKTKFLEIGCSFGGILNKVSESGVSSCHGVEPNCQDVEFIRRSNKAVEVFNSTFEDAELSANYYDVIVGIEVLEHLVCPRQFLEKCHSILTEVGLIHVEVPNHADVLLEAYTKTGYDKFYCNRSQGVNMDYGPNNDGNG